MPDDVHRRLKARAAEEGISMQDAARRAVREYVAKGDHRRRVAAAAEREVREWSAVTDFDGASSSGDIDQALVGARPPWQEANGSGAVSPAPYSSMKSSMRGSSGPVSSSWRPQVVMTTGADWSG